MSNAFIVSTLSLGQRVIGLHSDKNQIGRGSYNTSDESSCYWTNTFLSKIQFTSFRLFPIVDHFIVDSKSSGCVKNLTS